MPDPAPATENPLVPDAALERMATLLQAMRRTRRAAPPRALHAVYAALLTTLRPGDLLADLPAHTLPPHEATPLPLPTPTLAPGAAQALRAQQNATLLALITPAHTIKRPVLQQSADLPILYIAIPTPGQEGHLSRTSQRLGVPGIPVDAADPVALFRVLSECALRARSGDGPALLEPIPWPLGPSPDPLRQLQALLRRRRTAHQ